MNAVFHALAEARRREHWMARQGARAATTAAQEVELAEAACRQASTDDERRRRRIELRFAEVALRDQDLEEHEARLRQLADEPPSVDSLDFEGLKQPFQAPPFDPGDLDLEEAPPILDHYLPPPPVGIQKFFSRARSSYEAKTAAGKARYEEAVRSHQERESTRQARLEEVRAEHERTVRRMEAENAARHAEIDGIKARLHVGDPEAVVAFLAAMIESSDLPDGFPQQGRVTLVPDSGDLLVDYELPTLSVVPEASSYEYVSASDRISATPRPPSRRRDLYTLVVAAIALRTVRELFDADRSAQIRSVAFNGYASRGDKPTDESATGHAARVCLVSLRAPRESFEAVEKRRSDPSVALKALGGSLSPNAAELSPVRPVTLSEGTGARFEGETSAFRELIEALDPN